MKSDKPVNILIDEFISEQDTRPEGQRFTEWRLQRFVKWMIKNQIDVRHPRRADIIRYKTALINEGKSATTINTYLAAVRQFFKWLEDNGIYENIAAAIRSPIDRRQFRKEYLNPEQVADLLDSIPRNTLIGKRDFAMVYLMVVYGLRRVEILRLLISDLEETGEGPVLKIQRKGRNFKEKILLLPEVFEPIQDYLVKRGNFQASDPLFANHSQHPQHTLSPTMVSRIVKTYLKNVSDSKKLTCHSLRHSAAINLLKLGKSIYDVQQLLGHTSTNTTEIYLAAIKQERQFRNPLTGDLVEIYGKAKKRPKNSQFSANNTKDVSIS